MLTLRSPTTAGDVLAGASGSSTTISLSGVAMIRLADRPLARAMTPRRLFQPDLLRDEAGFGHELGVQLVVLFEEVEHLLAGQEAWLERLFCKVARVFGGLRHLLEQVDVERALLRRHLAGQEEGAQ